MGTPTLVNSKDLADFAATRAATDTPSRHGPSPRCESARFEVEEFTRFIIALDETIRWEDIRPKTVQAPLMDGGLIPPSRSSQDERLVRFDALLSAVGVDATILHHHNLTNDDLCGLSAASRPSQPVRIDLGFRLRERESTSSMSLQEMLEAWAHALEKAPLLLPDPMTLIGFSAISVMTSRHAPNSNVPNFHAIRHYIMTKPPEFLALACLVIADVQQSGFKLFQHTAVRYCRQPIGFLMGVACSLNSNSTVTSIFWILCSTFPDLCYIFCPPPVGG